MSDASASSSARTLDSLPTTKGVIMYGKMTTSRIGIIGNRFVSDLSLDVSMERTLGELQNKVEQQRGIPLAPNPLDFTPQKGV